MEFPDGPGSPCPHVRQTCSPQGVFAKPTVSLVISLGIVTQKALLNMGKVCHRVLSLADSGNLLSLEKK